MKFDFNKLFASSPVRLFTLGVCWLFLFTGVSPAPAQNPSAPAANKEEQRKEFSRQLLWGRTLLEERDYRGAYVSLKQAVALDPDSASAWSLLGNVQFALGEREDARKSWNRTGAKDPAWTSLVDKKLERWQQLDHIVFALAEFHTQDIEGPSPLTVFFSKPFAEKKIILTLAPAAAPKENLPPFSMLEPGALDTYRSKYGDSLLILAEAYSYLPTPLPAKTPLPEKSGPPVEKGTAGPEIEGYRMEAMMKAKAYDLATGKVLADYTQPAEGAGPTPEAALKNTLRLMGEGMGEEIRRQLLDALTPRPDLVINEDDLELPNASVIKEAAVEIRMRVKNTGEEIAYNFDVTLYEGAPRENKIIATFNIPVLWPDRSVTLEALWNPPALGYTTLTASADVKNLVLENSLTNNSTSQRVYVLSEAQVLSNLFDYAQKYLNSPADKELLFLQKRLYEKPKDQEAAKAFLARTLDREKNQITVYGLGPRPLNLSRETTTAPLARRIAQYNAQRWLNFALALKQGKTPPEIKAGFQRGEPPARGASILEEQELPDGSYLVKMQMPVR